MESEHWEVSSGNWASGSGEGEGRGSGRWAANASFYPSPIEEERFSRDGLIDSSLGYYRRTDYRCIKKVDQEQIEQVRTNNDAAFQCNFLFNMFFIQWMLSVLIELYHQIPIDFT